ncbi:MAG: hypothetical protein N5P05_004590 [Chroococcopsis gigantea SAG 12.99]|nr:hypothetical protein [Chroococcopsis gigantea SAG 12.99]
MPRIEGSVTRCDIRVPNDIYEKIEALAIEKGAKTHHRSHKPEVTGTILDLIKIGLANPHLSDNSSDTVADLSDEKLEDIVSKVSDKVTDSLTDKLEALSSLSDRVSDIEGIKDELMGK